MILPWRDGGIIYIWGRAHVFIKIVTEYLKMFEKVLRNHIAYAYQKLQHTHTYT